MWHKKLEVKGCATSRCPERSLKCSVTPEVFTLSSSDWSLCYQMSGNQILHEWLEVGNDTVKIQFPKSST